MGNCLTCKLTAQRDAGTAPLWDSIHRTEYWDVVHAYNSSLLGWLVLVLRRHVESLDALTDAEAVEMGLLVRDVSVALKEATGCVKTYAIQFAEAAQHPHVHVHVVARMADQPDAYRGPGVFGYMNVPEDEHVSEDEMNKLAEKIAAWF